MKSLFIIIFGHHFSKKFGHHINLDITLTYTILLFCTNKIQCWKVTEKTIFFLNASKPLHEIFQIRFSIFFVSHTFIFKKTCHINHLPITLTSEEMCQTEWTLE